MEFFDEIILGITQGISEFLPISSSAHLLLAARFLKLSELSLKDNVGLHFGTALALCAYYKDLGYRMLAEVVAFGFRLFSPLKRGSDKKPDTSIILLIQFIVIGSIPAAAVGLFFKKWIEHQLHHQLHLSIPLAVFGVVLWMADRYSFSHRLLKPGFKDAVIIGAWQALALIPGVSRSGATLTAARLCGFNRVDSCHLSFMLGAVAMVGATILEAKAIATQLWTGQFWIAILCSFVSGYLMIKVIMKVLPKIPFWLFMVYRIILALAILGLPRPL